MISKTEYRTRRRPNCLLLLEAEEDGAAQTAQLARRCCCWGQRFSLGVRSCWLYLERDEETVPSLKKHGIIARDASWVGIFSMLCGSKAELWVGKAQGVDSTLLLCKESVQNVSERPYPATFLGERILWHMMTPFYSLDPPV